MNSALYDGRVVHVRPGKHRLAYSVFMLALDLDELAALDGKLRLFAHNRLSLMALYDRDHAARTDAPLRPQIEAMLREAGVTFDGGPITLLTMPRVLNYVFNPISVYFCRRQNGDLAALVHQVNNTFGEHHFYALPACETGGAVRQQCDKRFFVSPFLEMDLRYEFTVQPPAGTVSIAITAKRGADVALTASFAGKRRELSDAVLVRAFLGNPLLTVKVIAGIHWEALRMMAKGVRYRGRRVHARDSSEQNKAAA